MRRYTLEVAGEEYVVDVDEQGTDVYAVTIDGAAYTVRLADDGESGRPLSAPKVLSVTPAMAVRHSAVAVFGKDTVKAPMPGVIIEVCVKAGERVERGQTVVVLDAMKMHNMVGAPRAGIVAEVLANEGQSVAYGEPIMRLIEE